MKGLLVACERWFGRRKLEPTHPALRDCYEAKGAGAWAGAPVRMGAIGNWKSQIFEKANDFDKN